MTPAHYYWQAKKKSANCVIGLANLSTFTRLRRKKQLILMLKNTVEGNDSRTAQFLGGIIQGKVDT